MDRAGPRAVGRGAFRAAQRQRGLGDRLPVGHAQQLPHRGELPRIGPGSPARTGPPQLGERGTQIQHRPGEALGDERP